MLRCRSPHPEISGVRCDKPFAHVDEGDVVHLEVLDVNYDDEGRIDATVMRWSEGGVVYCFACERAAGNCRCPHPLLVDPSAKRTLVASGAPVNEEVPF